MDKSEEQNVQAQAKAEAAAAAAAEAEAAEAAAFEQVFKMTRMIGMLITYYINHIITHCFWAGVQRVHKLSGHKDYRGWSRWSGEWN